MKRVGLGLVAGIATLGTLWLCSGTADGQACNPDVCLNALGSEFHADRVFTTRDGKSGFDLDAAGLLATLIQGNSSCTGRSVCRDAAGFVLGQSTCVGLGYACDQSCPASLTDLATQRDHTDHLDYRWINPFRFDASNGGNYCTTAIADGDARFFNPWEAPIFDLKAQVNRVVLFPSTDHGPLPCEAFEYSVYLTDNPNPSAVREIVTRQDLASGVLPDPQKWNEALLIRAFIGWDAANDAVRGSDPSNPLTPDGYATVWALPCGIAFRYTAVVSGNIGNPTPECQFLSNDAELDAVAGLNEDDTSIRPDADGDGHRSAACGGDDCCDSGNETYPGCSTATAATIYPGAPQQCGYSIARDCSGTPRNCPSGQTCISNTCVFDCGPNNGCPSGFACQGGHCLPANCGAQPCPTGTVCQGTTCVDACQGATCPAGQTCVMGTCVDPCQGVLCPQGNRCDDGQCVIGCSCTGCAVDQVCDDASNTCIPVGCDVLTCPPGQRCDTGGCVDACSGVVCPLGEVCQQGACVADQCFGLNCPSGQTCVSGACLDSCIGTDCQPGFECRAGACIDVCTGVVCPTDQVCVNGDCVATCGSQNCTPGQICQNNQCVAAPPPDGGLGDGSVPTDQSVPDFPLPRDLAAADADLASPPPDSGGHRDRSGGHDTRVGEDTSAAADQGGVPPAQPGCGCATADPSPVRSSAMLGLLGLAFALVTRRGGRRADPPGPRHEGGSR